MKKILPEGYKFKTEENKSFLSSAEALKKACALGETVEARAILCDKEHNLHVDLGVMKGIIPRTEGAIGIDDGSVRDIALISRVNKTVAFKILRFETDENLNTYAILSRKAAQIECRDGYISSLRPGDIIDARVTHMESFGVFADIGAGISALLPIDSISISRIPHPKARFNVNQDIKAIVKAIDEFGRVTLTHKELLGTWAENAEMFSVGETVPGIVRSVENFGIFVELTPNLAGLAEVTASVETDYFASVYIKSILPDKMKIKLIIVDAFPQNCTEAPPLKYYINEEHIDYWRYSPDNCDKIIDSAF